MTIVKVQRPLMTTGPVEWMIHAKGRKHSQMMRDFLVPPHIKDAMGKDYKAYFHGTWSDITGWKLAARATPQNW